MKRSPIKYKKSTFVVFPFISAPFSIMKINNGRWKNSDALQMRIGDKNRCP